MSPHLYFICPTDHLETVINGAFNQKSHYITSLGNSIDFSPEKIADINGLLRTHQVKDISFVLADDNQIVLDTERKQVFKNKLEAELHARLHKQEAHARGVWQHYDARFLRLSYHLNNKIKELKYLLCLALPQCPTISGKIYCRDDQKFTNIYSCLICNEYTSLNWHLPTKNDRYQKHLCFTIVLHASLELPVPH